MKTKRNNSYLLVETREHSVIFVRVSMPKENIIFITANHWKQGLGVWFWFLSFVWAAWCDSKHVINQGRALYKGLHRQHVFGIREFADLSLFSSIRGKYWYHMLLHQLSARKTQFPGSVYMPNWLERGRYDGQRDQHLLQEFFLISCSQYELDLRWMIFSYHGV
jgi:hypothetical protein